MLEYQQRVIEEKQALDDKLQRLDPFVASNTFKALSLSEQERLKRQLSLMQQYAAVLGERIAAFS